jgi:hypothetical protein
MTVPALLCALAPGLGAQEAPPHGAGHATMRHRAEGMAQMRRHADPMTLVRMYAPSHLLERRDLLALSTEQVSQLESLATELEEAHQAADAEAGAHHAQVMQAWQADAPDPSRLRAHAEAAMAAQHQAHLALLTAAAQAKGLLTPEQRGRVQGWLDARQMMMYQRMQGMMGGAGLPPMLGRMGQMPGCCGRPAPDAEPGQR